MNKTYQWVLDALNNPENFDTQRKYSLTDCHAPGVVSLVVDGEPGLLTRVFYATQTVWSHDVQLHTHKYGLNITHLRGTIKHIRATDDFHGDVGVPRYMYISPITGEIAFQEDGFVYLTLKEYTLPPFSTVALNSEAIHTMYAKKGAMWIVEECGFDTDTSYVFGAPFKKTGMYNKLDTLDFEVYKHRISRQLEQIIELSNPKINNNEGRGTNG